MQIFKTITISILLLQLSTVATSQSNFIGLNLSDSLNYVKKSLRSDGRLTTSVTTLRGRSAQFQRFLFLYANSSNADLVNLTEDSSACIRLYAYFFLKYNRFEGLSKITKKLMSDTTPLRTMHGCIPDNSTVRNIMININRWYSRKGYERDIEEFSYEKVYMCETFIFTDKE